MSKTFDAARADRRSAAWARRNAALFADDVEMQLEASLAVVKPPVRDQMFARTAERFLTRIGYTVLRPSGESSGPGARGMR